MSTGSGFRLAVVIAVIGMAVSGAAGAQDVPGCGNLRNGYGPFDYRDPGARSAKLPIVEAYHFTPEIEALQAGLTGSVIDELDYTLRAFPNHHRALQSLARYAINGGKLNLSHNTAGISSIDCYFSRAATFAPDDELVRVLYGNLLYRRKDVSEAKLQYETAVRLAPDSPEISYNAGLFFFDMGDLKKAQELADVAYKAGYPLQGLRNKLLRAEKSKDSRPEKTPASSPGTN